MRIRFIHSYLVVLLFLFSVHTSNSQVIKDAGLWTTLNLEKKFNKKVSFFLTEEFRMRENITRLNLFYTDLGFSYKPKDFLKLSLSYRNIQKYSIDNTFSFRHRFTLDIVLKTKLDKIGLSYRHRIQTEYRDIQTSENGMLPEWFSRSRFEAKYDLGTKLIPYLSVELRYQIKAPRQVESDGTWHRIRYAGGINYEIDKRNTFGAYYLIQNEFNVSSPQYQYIIGLEYSITL
jgi:hypothetical protein